MQDSWKAVWSIPYVSVAFFPSLKQNFIAYRSSKVSSRPDCIFEIHQLWQSGFSRVYLNCCCSCSFEPEIIKIGQSSHKMYNNNILNFQESDNFKWLYKESLETYLMALLSLSLGCLCVSSRSLGSRSCWEKCPFSSETGGKKKEKTKEHGSWPEIWNSRDRWPKSLVWWKKNVNSYSLFLSFYLFYYFFSIPSQDHSYLMMNLFGGA